MAEDTVQTTALAPVERPAAPLLPVAPDPSILKLDNQYWSSYDESTREGRMGVGNAMLCTPVPLASMIGETIRIRHVLAHFVTLADQNSGELKECPRVVVQATDGTYYGCVSMGVRKALGLIAKVEGPPPWKDGLLVKVVQTQTSAKNRWLTLELMDEAPAPAKKAKGA